VSVESNENKRNERNASFGRKKKSEAKRVLIPMFLLLVVAGVIAGFVIYQYDGRGASSGSDIVYDLNDDEQHPEAEGVLNNPEFNEVRLIDVSRFSGNHANAEWIIKTELLPRKINELGDAISTYTNGLKMSPRPGGFRNTRINWSGTYSYLSFDIGVAGNGGAIVYIECIDSPRTSMWEQRTIPPGQIVSVRNLNVSESGGGMRIVIRSANDQDINAWILDPVLSMAEVSGGSAQDGIVGVLEAPLAANTPTLQPTEAISNDEQLEEHDIVLASNGVSLSTVEVISSNYYRVGDQLFISSSGHRYHESFEFSVSTYGDYFDYTNSYVIYNLNSNYTAFFAEVVAPINLDENLEFLVEIAFDAEEPEITIEGFNVSMATVPIELDVSGVTNMYVIVRGRGREGTSDSLDSIRLGNAMLQ